MTPNTPPHNSQRAVPPPAAANATFATRSLMRLTSGFDRDDTIRWECQENRGPLLDRQYIRHVRADFEAARIREDRHVLALVNDRNNLGRELVDHVTSVGQRNADILRTDRDLGD